MAGEFERLAYEAALRGLDKQEAQLEELRARTGMLLFASSLAASFLGQQAFRNPHPRVLAVAALLAFVVSMGISVFILIPKEGLNFSGEGADVYAGLYEVRSDIAEVYRRLAYELDCFWSSNNDAIVKIARGHKIVAGALVIEVVSLAALLGDSIF
jgi:hypothetical protein